MEQHLNTSTRLLYERDLARMTGRAASCWQKDRVAGTGPKFIRVGRLVRYRESDVNEWLASRTIASTSEAK
jgi:predicted DNA-binding transcriptional regulator AlpA